jgi:2-phospho-L-lactate transferase/gluconeogenesis factor (CofD/UPF0052 family)
MSYMAHIEQQPSGLDIVVFGGGGGGSVMVGGLVEAMPDANITAIVPTGDSGSRTGDLRGIFGGPAIGDARKVLGAVASEYARDLFSDDEGRFGHTADIDTVKILNDRLLGAIEKNGVGTSRAEVILDDVLDHAKDALPGTFYNPNNSNMPSKLKGHTYTNLVLNALRLRHDGLLTPALAEMHQWVGAPRRVRILPVTEESHNLVMYDHKAKIALVGEGKADDHKPQDPERVEVWLEAGAMENRIIDDRAEAESYYAARHEKRAPRATAEVVGSTALSGVVVAAPGSLRTSLEDIYRTDGVSDGLRIQERRGGLHVVVTNLTEEKPGMNLATHLRTVQEASGRSVTHFIHNTDTASLPKSEVPIKYEPGSFDIGDAVAIGEALVDSHEVKANENDPIAHLRAKGHHNVWQIASVMKSKILVG